MKTIKIKSLKLTNFKGIRSLELNELSNESFIYGNNGTGKTTIFDAFTWLLFGKDSSDRKDFEIKTLDHKNNVIPKIDHEVEAVITVNGETITLRRILREKWVKTRGSLDAEFSGNETQYEWNGVPMNAGEFASKISSIVDEKVFKMITNPAAFNSLKWQDQRDVLIDISGNITDEEVARGHDDFESLILNLAGKSLDERKREVKASMTKSKNELKVIPTRIDEVERSKPEALDFDTLKTELQKKNEAIQDINNQMSDKLKAQQSDIDKQKEIQQDIHVLETELSGVRHQLKQKAFSDYQESLSKPREIQRKIESLDAEIKANENSILSSNSQIGVYKNQIKGLDTTILELRKEWEIENAKAFVMDENECACPTCKRSFDQADIDEKKNDLLEHFTSNKNANLKSITERGQSLSGQKMSLENSVIQLEKDVLSKEALNKTHWEARADLSTELKEASVEKTESQIYDELMSEKEAFFISKNKEISDKKEALENRPKVDVSELKQKLDELNTERDAIKNDLQKESQIQSFNKRIEELSNEERTLAQAIADIEKELFTIEAFEKEKSTRIEESVNNRFHLVNFKLFETQINGGEVPTCKALINGVPFSDANTASKINAGIDIINTLCMHYKANAPIFIDNRESVVQLIPTESQIINLIVSEDDMKLRVEDKPLSYTDHVFKEKLEAS